MTDGQPSDDLDLLAAEYALGLLDGEAWAMAHALVRSDPAFAERVQQWQSEGAEWLLEIDPVSPPDTVWQGLAPLFGDAPEASPALSESSADNVVAIGKHAAADDEARKWRGRAYAAMAASMVLALGLGWQVMAPGTPVPAPPTEAARIALPGNERPATLNLAAAQIIDTAGEPLVTALFDPASGDLWVDAASIADEGRALELWALDGAGTPYSLGIIDGTNPQRRLAAPLGTILARDGVIAVTIEDIASAPHKAPTSAVLGTAKLKVL